MTDTCKDGTHGHQMLTDAVADAEPFVVITGGSKTEIDYCGRGNFAAYGQFFKVIGESVAGILAEGNPEKCETCVAQAAAVMAGYAAYQAALRAHGILPKCN